MRIKIRQLVVQFPQREHPALDGVDLTVEPGEHVALLGSSGSGKTTLLRAIVAAVPATSGEVGVDGLDPNGSHSNQRQVRRSTGIVRQRDDLVTGLRAQTNAVIATAPTWSLRDWFQVLCGRVPVSHRDRLQELAQRHGLTEHLTSRVEHLSGGQRQRVALVRALLPQPRLLLADEPTSGLDPVTARAAVDSLRAVAETTLILSTHDLAVARRFPRVVALRDGRIAFDGVPTEEQMEAIYQPAGVSS